MSGSSSTKRRLSKSEAPIPENSNGSKKQNTLHYYFSKNTTVETASTTTTACPICNEKFQVLSIAQLELHINACLDSIDFDESQKQSESASTLDGGTKEKQGTLEQEKSSDCDTPQEGNVKRPVAKSWAELFSEATFEIRGIWSSSKKDVAPGMTESEQSWFGEPKSTMVIKKQSHVPYYKRLAGTHMVVDTFSFGEIAGCEGYLLSHFHSDHYRGLSKSWIYGPIYCSEITARLVETKLGVAADFIYPLSMNTPCLLSGTDRLSVTLIDANHCPGAVMFLITTKDNLRYLHTGDFRACRKMCLNPMLKDKPLDIVYLDTTYLHPKYSFPSQDSCIASACQLAKRHQDNGTMRSEDPKIDHWFVQEKNKEIAVKENGRNAKLLVVVGTYALGKERMFIEIAKSLNSKIFVTDQKRAVLDTLQDQELNDFLTDVPSDAQVHVIPLGHLHPEAYFYSLRPEFTQMIAFRPTGWTFRTSAGPQQQSRSLESIIRARTADLTAAALMPCYDTPLVKIYGVPYSEHSSFRELALFIASLEIHRIVPTVNVDSVKSRLRMSQLFEAWDRDKKKFSNGTVQTIDYLSINSW